MKGDWFTLKTGKHSALGRKTFDGAIKQRIGQQLKRVEKAREKALWSAVQY